MKANISSSASRTSQCDVNQLLQWLGGRVVREPDLRSTGRGFKSRPIAGECNPGQVVYVHTRASVTKQYNLVPANVAVMLGSWGGNRGPGRK